MFSFSFVALRPLLACAPRPGPSRPSMYPALFVCKLLQTNRELNLTYAKQIFSEIQINPERHELL